MPVQVEALLNEPYRQLITANGHSFYSDVLPEQGGANTAPNPHQLLFGAWGACTVMTIQMYAHRKGWSLESIRVTFEEEHQAGKPPIIRKSIQIEGSLTEEQHKLLKIVAEKCPVNQLIIGEKQIIKSYNY